jgi:hypothetical protein
MNPEQTDTESQRRIAEMVRSIDVRAPAALHASIEEMVAGASRRHPTPRRARALLGRTPALLAGAGALAAAALLLVILALGGGTGAGSPTVLEASALALRPAMTGAPEENPRAPGELQVIAGGIHYPYWEHRFGWHAAGVRYDRLGGRIVTTVFYANAAGQRIGYGIVDGKALAFPTAGRSAQWHGVRFQVFDSGVATVVTWRHTGHTCILVGSGVGAKTLLTLADWRTA